MKTPFSKSTKASQPSELQHTHIKFCGITREEDIHAAVEAGADALGFVLWSNSKRAITLEHLIALSRQVPDSITRVGLFVNPSAEEVVDAAPYLDLVQFHGDETPAFCGSSPIPWIKALRMRPALEVEHEITRYSQGSGILLDAYQPGLPGGTGHCFDWARIPQGLSLPIILAGGLTADNVAEAIARTTPYAVDVSGGIESAPGEKSITRMNDFARAVRRADARINED